MKSTPWRLNASTGAGAPLLMARRKVMRQLSQGRMGDIGALLRGGP